MRAGDLDAVTGSGEAAKTVADTLAKALRADILLSTPPSLDCPCVSPDASSLILLAKIDVDPSSGTVVLSFSGAFGPCRP